MEDASVKIVGGRRFVEIPGTKLHELPPLLVKVVAEAPRLDRVMHMAQDLVEQEDLLDSQEALALDAMELDRRRMDLAVNLVDRYMLFVAQWQWGDSIVEWIRQCETTFGTRLELRNVLRHDVWPHAGRSSFVTLLGDKHVETGGVALEKAVGMRLTFRQPPPLRCFSNQFLFYLDSTVGTSAYDKWSAMSSEPVSALPPERFYFDVINLSVA
jgi:hypothetical protein